MTAVGRRVCPRRRRQRVAAAVDRELITTLSRTAIQSGGPLQQLRSWRGARIQRDVPTAADEQSDGRGSAPRPRFGSLAALLLVELRLADSTVSAKARTRGSAPAGMTPRLRMSHISSLLTPSSAAMIGSGSDDCAHARVESRAQAGRHPLQQVAARLPPVRVRCSISRPVESAPALTATRQELAASISAFTHCAITDRIYVSYSFDVVAGSRSMTDLMASS